MEDTSKEKKELAWAKDRLNRELEKLKLELSDVRGHLSTAESDRLAALSEVKTVQQLLLQSKETEVCDVRMVYAGFISGFRC